MAIENEILPGILEKKNLKDCCKVPAADKGVE